MILGIDPGLSGACALYDGTRLEVWDLPILEIARSGKKRRELDLAVLADKLADLDDLEHAYIEQSWPRPTDGATAGYKTGYIFGAIQGILMALEVPTTVISPQRWKRALGVSADKDGARARASQLMPTHTRIWPLKRHDGRAEAALIAYYGFPRIQRTAAE